MITLRLFRQLCYNRYERFWFRTNLAGVRQHSDKLYGAKIVESEGFFMAKADSKSTKTNKTSLEQVLNEQVANLNVLYVKLHNYHWYVKGSNFYSLHAKFEELYNEVTAAMDAVAERLLTIKGNPSATLKEYLEIATIQEATGKEDASTMVQNLVEDFATLSESFQEGVDFAEKSEDAVTADLLTGYKGDFEKHMWMLRSFLG
ncbi:DNA protection during starvation protein 1 [compost metagenome]